MTETTEIGQQIDQLVAEMATVKVTDEAGFRFVSEWLKRLKATQRIVLAHKKARYAEYKTVLDEMKIYTERIIFRFVADYLAEQERLREEERRRLEAEERKRQEERLLAEAEATGDESILNEPITVAPVHVAPAAPKVEGIAFLETWRFEIIDERAIPREYLAVDEKKIGQVVRAMKGATQIPGVRVYADKTVRAGAA